MLERVQSLFTRGLLQMELTTKWHPRRREPTWASQVKERRRTACRWTQRPRLRTGLQLWAWQHMSEDCLLQRRDPVRRDERKKAVSLVQLDEATHSREDSQLGSSLLRKGVLIPIPKHNAGSSFYSVGHAWNPETL